MWDRLKYEYAKKRDLDPEEVLPYFKKNIPMHNCRSSRCDSGSHLFTDRLFFLFNRSIY